MVGLRCDGPSETLKAELIEQGDLVKSYRVILSHRPLHLSQGGQDIKTFENSCWNINEFSLMVGIRMDR